MATNTHHVADKIFNLLKGYGYQVKSYDRQGKLVINPLEATRFLVNDPNILVRMDLNKMIISLATSEDLSDHPLRKNLKDLTFDAGPSFSFDYRVFGKKIKAKGEKLDVSKSTEKDIADVMEGFASLTGTAKTSYQPLDSVKIVIKHKHAVNEHSRGARSRNIHSIYVKKGSEKFKMQENNLKAARAMARHLNNGGTVNDAVSVSINEMASEYAKLKDFVKYVQSANLVNEQNQQYVTLAVENINNIRNMFDKLAGSRTYATAVESLQHRNSVSVLNDDVDLESQFVEKHFDNRVAAAMDSIKMTLARQQAYEAAIVQAIQKETFTTLKDLLKENDVLDFATPHAKLSHQVAQMSQAVRDPRLSTCLSDISKKLYDGGTMNQFEYTTVKSCLLSANEARLRESSNDAPYEVTIHKFSSGEQNISDRSIWYEVRVNGEEDAIFSDINDAMDHREELLAKLNGTKEESTNDASGEVINFNKKQRQREIDKIGNTPTINAIRDDFMFHDGWQLFRNDEDLEGVYELGRFLKGGRYQQHPRKPNYISIERYPTLRDVADYFEIKITADDEL